MEIDFFSYWLGAGVGWVGGLIGQYIAYKRNQRKYRR